MYETLRRLFWRGVYVFKQRPTADEIEAKFKELEGRLIEAKTAVSDRCDCLVSAGGQVVYCKPNIPTYECSALGDENPSLTVSPLPVGGCKNIPKS